MKNKTLLANPKYILEKLDVRKVDRSKISRAMGSRREELAKIFSSANQPIYIYWDKFRHKQLSTELTSEEQWLLVRTYRDISSIKTVIKSENGKHFIWVRPPSLDENLHNIDMLVGGQIFPRSRVPVGSKETYISRGAIEEAIASSQLEGAHTTRVAARKLILEKRVPKNESEQMILNNYKAMLALDDDFKNKKLSRNVLLELHSILTHKTLDESQQKRFRRDSDEIVVEGEIGNKMYTAHIPPREKFLEAEIDRLIAYANDELEETFTHPIIKAIFIHFWVGYLHPFTDGNGRLARALFYWYLLRNKYWAFSYLPISTVIKKSPKQYAMAYIYSEQDSNDLTYFFDYHMRKISQSIEEFDNYVQRQTKQNQHIKDILEDKVLLNERQKQLVFYFISEKKASATTTSHSTINNVSRQTAAKDLKELENLGLIKPRREGKYIRYYSSKGIQKLAN